MQCSKVALLLFFTTRIFADLSCQNADLTDVQYICDEANTEDPVPGICADWCESPDGVKVQVINDEEGLVILHVVPSPQTCNHDNYEFELFVIENMECDSDTEQSEFLLHSWKVTDIKRINLMERTNCTNDLKLEFEYIFTGCYKLVVKPKLGSNSWQPCHTFFNIKTKHVKTLLPNPLFNDVGKENSLIHYVYWESIKPKEYLRIKCLDISLMMVAPHENILSEVQTCSLDSNYQNWTAVGNNSCHCRWLSVAKFLEMECTFDSLKSGKYSVRILGYDPRCETYSVWSENSHCLWTSELNFTSSNGTDSAITGPKREELMYHLIIVCFIIICAVIVLIILAVLFYKLVTVRKKIIYDVVPLQMETNKNGIIMNKKIRVLLLYPRDCQPFMESMRALRRFLKSINNFEVIDPLDEELFEEVAASLNTWGLNYLSDNSTKVILAASQLSVKLHDAFLSGNQICYHENNSFDHLFPLYLNNLFLENMQYKKIYVIRLDTEHVENMVFQHIAQCRNFTLPQCLESLLLHLLESSSHRRVSIKDHYDHIPELEKSIQRYSAYLKANPNYLDHLTYYK